MNTNYLNLEDIVMKIATRLINIPYGEFNERIQEALEMIGTFLDIDRVYVFDYDFENETTSNTFEWCKNGVEPQIEYLQNVPINEILDDWVEAHIKGQMIVYEDVMSLDKSSRIYKILAPQGILSICTVPLNFHNQCFGFVGFDDIRHTRRWEERDFKLLKVIAEMLVNTLIKQKYDILMVELKEKAQSANEAKTTFLAQMSHEIRTPLNGIYNAFYLLSQSIKHDEYKNYVEIAQTSLDSLSSIVNNILDLSKIEARKMSVTLTPVDLEHEIVKTLKTIKPSIKSKSLDCIFDFDYEIKNELIVDIRKINQILLNLINNAIKFTDEGYIKTTVKKAFYNESSYLLLSIEDSGIGMSKDDKEHILESFYQAKNNDNKQGTGLGVTIINELITLMGGIFVINSELGVGSKFDVYLPFEDGKALAYSYKNKHVLLISKRDLNISIIKNMLLSMGYQISINKLEDNIKYDVLLFDNDLIDRESMEKMYIDNLNDGALISLISDNLQKNTYVDLAFEYPISRKMFDDSFYKTSNSKLDISDSKVLLYGNVLVVDDNEINREALSAILSMHGVNSQMASSGNEAVMLTNSIKFDLILMDLQMPHMNGYQASEIIKTKSNYNMSTPIIAVTANVFLNLNKLPDMINHVIYKPVQVDILLSLISKYLPYDKTINIPSELKVFNREQFNLLFDNSLTSGKILVDRFLIDYKDDLNDINRIINTNNTNNELYEKLHYMKGPLSYICADRVLYMITSLMDQARISDFKSKSFIVQLEHEYNLLVKELNQIEL